jgi:hypothetical protein
MWFLIIMMSSTGLLNSAEQVALYGPYQSRHACDLAGELFDASGYAPTGARIADATPKNTVAACTKLYVVHANGDDVNDSDRRQ